MASPPVPPNLGAPTIAQIPGQNPPSEQQQQAPPQQQQQQLPLQPTTLASAAAAAPPPQTPKKKKKKGLEDSVLLVTAPDEETEDGRIRNREASTKIRDAWIYKQVRARQDEFTNYQQVNKHAQKI